MNIVDKRQEKLTPLKEMKPGDCFVQTTGSRNVFMVLDKNQRYLDSTVVFSGYPVFNLTTGKLDMFNGSSGEYLFSAVKVEATIS